MSRRNLFIALVLFAAVSSPVFAQVDEPLISLRRGMLWHSFYYAKDALPFSNWTRISYGLDWPGYDPEWIGAPIGGPTSYMTTGGMWITAKDDSGRIISVEDWAMYAGTVGVQGGSKYQISKHARRWPRGENFWLQANPAEAQEVIDTEWERNPAYVPTYTGDRALPLNVKRTVRQWAGSQLDENYIIVEYKMKNISPTDTMRGTHIMLSYALSPNYRGWSTLFANLNAGARNTRFSYFPSGTLSRTMAAFADDYPETPVSDSRPSEKFDFYKDGGPEGKGEFLAPGYVGFRLLYSSPDSSGTASRVSKSVWSAAPNDQDLYGPFGSASAGLEGRYNIVRDPSFASESFTSATDTRMTRRRLWSLLSLGPWTLKPGDTIKVVVAEFVAGPPYALAIDPAANIGGSAQTALTTIPVRAMLAYNNNYNIPDVPPSPEFTIEISTDPGKISNILKWKNDREQIADPDYSGAEAKDFAGYRIYRSGYLPLGPWKKIADIKKDSAGVFNASTQSYTYVDDSVAVGSAYYYAITAYDKGHTSWPPNPGAFPMGVPPMESSIYASLYAKSALNPAMVISPFRTTIPAANSMSNILVVPNPFVLESGSAIPQDYSNIQFINVPSPCIIRIYSIRGDLVKTIRHDDGSGIALWNQRTDFGQFAVSGLYVYQIETPAGSSKTGKLVIIR